MSLADLGSSSQARQQGMRLLAGATPADLDRLWSAWAQKPEFKIVRGPETGLVMVRGRMGGGGDAFNLGEATVTRATVRLAGGQMGHAYCLGRDREKALRAAVFDALWQSESTRGAVETDVLQPLREAADAADKARRDETAATRVDFFTMVRGED
jgi:alpha-D-ribose 1-methylphosphonate 5-triphosphate synthase subunit PhnG